jgi:hypothetical protein
MPLDLRGSDDLMCQDGNSMRANDRAVGCFVAGELKSPILVKPPHRNATIAGRESHKSISEGLSIDQHLTGYRDKRRPTVGAA